MSLVRRTEYCLCGSSLTIAATSRMGLDKAFATWREGHIGEGHRPATRQEAYMARIRNDQKDAAQRAQEVHGETTLETLS